MAQQKAQSLLEEDILPPVARISASIFAVCWIGGVSLLSWRIIPLVHGRDSVPLHYNIYVGIDAFGPWWMLCIIPALSLAFAIFNGIFAKTFLKRRPMLAITLWSATLFVGILALLALVRIILINIAYG